jgi:D-alanyl-D-alanine carboxypeptidase
VHANAAAHLDQVLVALDTAQPQRLTMMRPQLVVAGYPDDLGEPVAQRAEHPLDVGRELADVSGQDQPIRCRPRADRGGDLPVLTEADMQVARREQPRTCRFDVWLPPDRLARVAPA